MIETYLKKLPWKSGHAETGYQKIRLFESARFKCDSYLLYYPCGSEIPAHVDSVSFGRHYRVNVILKKALVGGDFICADPIFSKFGVNLFRPDISPHAVSRVESGYRVVLSFGWVR